MELWTEVRRRVLTGEISRRRACVEYELHWQTLQKILGHVEPPGYCGGKPRQRRKMERFLPLVAEILVSDAKAPKKQRHTAQRIFDRLVESLQELNDELAKRCDRDLDRTLRGKSGSKRDLLVEERQAMLDLPRQPFDARRVTQALANSLSLVKFDTNRYSVPVKHAHRPITIVATVDEVRLIDGDRLVARHGRSWKREQDLFDPVHYLALLEKKPGGFDHAKPLEEWQLPESFATLRQTAHRDISAHYNGARKLLVTFVAGWRSDPATQRRAPPSLPRRRRAARSHALLNLPIQSRTPGYGPLHR